MLKKFTAAVLAGTALATAAHAGDWNNFYVGGVGTIGVMSSDISNSEGFFGAASQANWGGGIGGTVGKNWQSDSFVWGLEADGSWVDFKNSLTSTVCCTETQLISTKWGWYATMRARMGLDVDDTLFYATGGVALVGVKTRASETDTEGGEAFGPLPESKTEVGIALGAGVERRISDNLSFKAEFLYIGLPSTSSNTFYDLTTHTVDCTDCGAVTYRSSAQMIRIGLNWQLDQ